MFKRRNYTWNDGKSLSLCDRTLIMGILNGTPDSFSDGGKFNTPEAAAAHVTQMIEDGADIIDLGVESTRPGCTPLTADEEIERLAQLIDPVLHASTVPVSIDTYHAKTADYALSKGAHILNDIWGLHYDPDMGRVIETDEEIGRYADQFPEHVHLEDVGGEHQSEHRHGEEAQVGIIALETAFTVHVAERVDVHHERHGGNHHEHHHRDGIEEHTEVEMERTERQPREIVGDNRGEGAVGQTLSREILESSDIGQHCHGCQ